MPLTLAIATSSGSASSMVGSAGVKVNLASVFLPVATPGAAAPGALVAVGAADAAELAAEELATELAAELAAEELATELAAELAGAGTFAGASVGPVTIGGGTGVWYGTATPVGLGGIVG